MAKKAEIPKWPKCQKGQNFQIGLKCQKYQLGQNNQNVQNGQYVVNGQYTEWSRLRKWSNSQKDQGGENDQKGRKGQFGQIFQKDHENPNEQKMAKWPNSQTRSNWQK